MPEESYWYFTKPWEPVSIRRGDALGFRAASDYFADLLAPGLSNGTSDARWISLLSWCLNWSDIAWKKADNGDLSSRDNQRKRYAWLQPLELLWVARTLESGQTTGQLRGRRSIERWRKDDRIPSNFAMSDDQFRRYRQVGTYGAYRVVLRTMQGLTTGDGWTPGDTGRKLADLVNNSLPSKARLNQQHFESGTQWGHWSKGKQVEYWMKLGWAEWDKSANRGFRPTRGEAISMPLPEKERQLLEAALFPEDSIRRITASVLANARSAKSHADLCDALARSGRIAETLKSKNASLEALPAFSRLADAAMAAMRGLWSEIGSDKETRRADIAELARSDVMEKRLDQLRKEGDVWLNPSTPRDFPYQDVVTRLAEAMKNARTLDEQICALTRHHREYGGGRRWFNEKSGKLELAVRDNDIVTSDYRFRLRSLCLLAAQCGVASTANALNAMAPKGEDSVRVQQVEIEEEKDYAEKGYE
jgi:hypothetical protein